MRNTAMRIVLVILSVVLCFVVVLKVTAGSSEVVEVEAADENDILAVNQAVASGVSAICSPMANQAMIEEPETDIWPYPLSQEEIELIALVTMGEAEGETELGKRLVIDTILNRMDDSHFPDTVHDVIYQPDQFSVMWNGRIDRCYVMDDIVELVKEELLERTNYECVFFMAGDYSAYGEPMFQECCHFFSSYD